MGNRLNRIGQQLGNYRLTSLLGQGGFAEVYLGEHIHLGTKAAVKVLHTQLNDEYAETFRTEARTIAHLAHPHIIRILEFGVEGGTPFLVMDYAPNGALRKVSHFQGSPLAVATIVTYVKQIADALQYAHDKNLIHCDVKPENMLVGPNNEVLLSDFGIALAAQDTHHQGTQGGIGTVNYMSPEQIQGKPCPASDQYSLGIVVYEWLCGERPFHGSYSELCIQHTHVSPPSLCKKMPMISPEVERVVMKALAKDPKQRFASIRAFAFALEQASQINQPTHVSPAQKAIMVPYLVAVVVTTLLGLKLGLGLKLSSIIALIASAIGIESGASLIAFLVSSAAQQVLLQLKGAVIGSEAILGDISTKSSEIHQKIEIWSSSIIEYLTRIIGVVGAGNTTIGIASAVSLIVGSLLAGICAMKLTIRIVGAIIGLIIGATIVESIRSNVGGIVGSIIGLLTGFLAIRIFISLIRYIVSGVLALTIGEMLSYISRGSNLQFLLKEIEISIAVGALIGAGLGALVGLLVGALIAGIVVGIIIGILATIVLIVLILELLEKLGLAGGVGGVVMFTTWSIGFAEGFCIFVIGAMASVVIIGTTIGAMISIFAKGALIGTTLGAMVSIFAKGALIGLTGVILGLTFQMITLYFVSRRNSIS